MTKQRRNFNNCLRKYRKARGLNQQDVAEILGIKSTSMISRWEMGVCLPDLLNAFKLSIVYRTMTDALFIDQLRELREHILEREELVLKK
jgi:transcriptional regulator with XRE-family HTH domain